MVSAKSGQDDIQGGSETCDTDSESQSVCNELIPSFEDISLQTLKRPEILN